MAKPDIWMPLYIGDYLADTMHLTTEQHGAYLLLIMGYWRNGGPLPDDDRQLSAICRLGPDAWSNAKAVLGYFFDTEQLLGHWVHTRIEAEMEEAGKNKQKRVVRAQKAAEARWGKDAPSNAPSNAQALLEECPSPSPSPYKDKKLLSSKPDGGDGKEKTRRKDETPYAEILACYQRICGGKFLGAEVLTDKRKRNIKRAYDLEVRGEKPFKDRGLDFWEKYFSRCTTNRHWCGDNDREWKADLEFVTREANVLKVLGV